ncbi:alpha/beta hydrolase [Cellulomonas algicola]|uniref:alpha/beta hydrolase n=1 Tax=Cellulomonas algicola TaxID=2071633 RepID=UPI001C3F72FE|nr:alpha/beta hydrolase [Cellulomonas algicola]
MTVPHEAAPGDTGASRTPVSAARPAGLRGWAGRAVLGLLRASLLVSPRPTVLLVRRQFARGVVERTTRLDAQAPAGVAAVLDERYGPGADEVLDVFHPDDATGPLPTVVWTHGGAFVGGTKDELRGWFRLLASHGVTVVAPRYTRAPEARYPTPVRQVTAALRHVQEHAARFHVEPSRLVLAGDSAGAQISAQVATLTTVPSYARTLGVAPTVHPAQLRGVLLCCGVFDLARLDPRSPLRDVLRACGWAYSGDRRFLDDEAFLSSMSVGRHVTAAFPSTFVTVGNADPLRGQSVALAATLEGHGVDVETLFFPDAHTPALPHEYQFEPGSADADAALDRLVRFVRRCTA